MSKGQRAVGRGLKEKLGNSGKFGFSSGIDGKPLKVFQQGGDRFRFIFK